ncbi:prephenate dehydrogenase [Clostridium sp. MSJ-8]|uniref:prephenate dehydrogenase n=1 Tax=Clostridium sp. MSJ-8 TaxID=2841510 RepID=UPI001C0F25BA|nr:prephenate dehydrogenase [Clostridium sp. MSJ-8]MBU5488842.1 prephenate dehydrogenase [Clostridium sp. MSJ-8]
MKIVIVGLGVVGGSFAMCLKEAGYDDVYGIDTNEDTLAKAKKQGLIKEGYKDGSVILKSADLTIMSIYPKFVKGFIKENKDYFKKGSIVTDATGIKEMIMKDVIDIMPDDVDFVFGHPMAGREKKGIDYASAKVFHGANYIITPISRNKPENVDKIEELAYNLGFGRVKRITPEYHDEMIGYTSQLPHAMAVALINSDDENRDTGSFIGDSYRDLTRIANINEELWSDLFLGNKDNLLKSISNFEKQLDIIKNAIKNDDKDTLVECFIKSTSRREKLDN